MKLKEYAILPSYANGGDAGLDLFSCEEYLLEPNKLIKVSTGIALEIPFGYVGLIWDKSGFSTKNFIHRFAGVIDSTYRGEVIVALFNHSSKEYYIKKGDKVAQMLIQKIEHVDVVEADALEDTARGEKGFGSTGR